MNYTEWLKTVPAALTEDSVWKMIPDQRERALHEDSPSYAAGPVEASNGFPTHLLENIPLP